MNRLSRTLFAVALVVAMAVAALILVVRAGAPTADLSSDLVTIPGAVQPVATEESSTTTTVDPAVFEFAARLADAEAWAFVDAWWGADVSAYFDALRAAPPWHYAPPVAPYRAPTRSAAPTYGGSAPNAFLACVRQRESGGNYSAVNPSSGAGGAYQFLPSTWHAMGGQGLPQNASPAEQDRIAALTYQQQGRSPWAGGQYAC